MRNNLYICNAKLQTKTTLTSHISGSNFGTHYTLVENGLRTLLGENTKPKPPKGQKVPSDIDLYYFKIQEKYSVVLPDIKTLWPNKESFHKIRKDIVHHGKYSITKEEMSHLPVDVDDILKMLLFIEEEVRKVNPKYSVSF